MTYAEQLRDRLDKRLDLRFTFDDGLRGRIVDLVLDVVGESPVKPDPPTSLIPPVYAERIVGRTVKLVQDADGGALGHDITVAIRQAARDVLGEGDLSTLVRARIASTAASIASATDPSALKAAAEAIGFLAAAANTLQLGFNAQAEQQQALDRIAELERELARRPESTGGYALRLELKPGGYHWSDEAPRGERPPEVEVHVEAPDGAVLASGTTSMPEAPAAVRTAVAGAAAAIGDHFIRETGART
jgi:hypothetical protein